MSHPKLAAEIAGATPDQKENTDHSSDGSAHSELVPDGSGSLRKRRTKSQRHKQPEAIQEDNNSQTTPENENKTKSTSSSSSDTSEDEGKPLSALIARDHLPNSITEEAHNALVTDPSLMRLSSNAKETILG